MRLVPRDAVPPARSTAPPAEPPTREYRDDGRPVRNGDYAALLRAFVTGPHAICEVIAHSRWHPATIRSGLLSACRALALGGCIDIKRRGCRTFLVRVDSSTNAAARRDERDEIDATLAVFVDSGARESIVPVADASERRRLYGAFQRRRTARGYGYVTVGQRADGIMLRNNWIAD